MHWPYGPMGGYGSSWIVTVIMMLWWLLIVVAIVVAVIYLVRSSRVTAGGPSGETPLDIVRKRYARGEINREEYDKLRQDLSQ